MDQKAEIGMNNVDHIETDLNPLESGFTLASPLIWSVLIATAASCSALVLGASFLMALLCHSVFGALTFGLFIAHALRSDDHGAD